MPDYQNANSASTTSNLESIGAYAFFNTPELIKIDLKEKLLSIGEYAFAVAQRTVVVNDDTSQTITEPQVRGKMPYIVIPASIKTIGDFAFAYQALTDITLTSGLDNLGNYMFYNNDSLVAVSVPGTVTAPGNYTFAECDLLANITLNEGMTQLGDYMFFNDDSIIEITIPASATTSSGKHTFDNCSHLTTAIIKNTRIGDAMFMDCINLTKVNWNDEIVDELGTEAFSGCVSLTSVLLPKGEHVKEIKMRTFYHCTSIEEIIIPSNVTTIGVSAFEGCEGVLTLKILPGTVTILNDAFKDLWLVTELTIPTTVKSITGGAFNGFSSLVSLSIPFAGKERASVLETQNENHLFGFIFGGEVYKHGNCYAVSQKFSENTGAITYYIPNGLKDIAVTDDDNITYGAFNGMSSLEGITLPKDDKLRAIDDYSFEGCTSLESIVIPYNVNKLGDNAFAGCYILKSITFAKHPTNNTYAIKELGDNVFANDIALTNIVIPDTVTKMGKGVFFGCKNLQSLTIPFIGSTVGDTTENILNDDLFGYMFMGDQNPKYYKSTNNYVQFLLSTDSYEKNRYYVATDYSYSEINLTSTTYVVGKYFTRTGDGTRRFARCVPPPGLPAPPAPKVSMANFDSEATYYERNVTSYAKATGEFDSTEIYYYLKQDWSVDFNGETNLDDFVEVEQRVSDNDYLATYYIPASLRTVNVTLETLVGYGAFMNCRMLETINFTDTLTEIKDYAFYNLYAQELTGSHGVAISLPGLTYMNKTDSYDVCIPTNVVTMGAHAFENSDSIS